MDRIVKRYSGKDYDGPVVYLFRCDLVQSKALYEFRTLDGITIMAVRKDDEVFNRMAEHLNWEVIPYCGSQIETEELTEYMLNEIINKRAPFDERKREQAYQFDA